MRRTWLIVAMVFMLFMLLPSLVKAGDCCKWRISVNASMYCCNWAGGSRYCHYEGETSAYTGHICYTNASCILGCREYPPQMAYDDPNGICGSWEKGLVVIPTALDVSQTCYNISSDGEPAEVELPDIATLPDTYSARINYITLLYCQDNEDARCNVNAQDSDSIMSFVELGNELIRDKTELIENRASFEAHFRKVNP